MLRIYLGCVLVVWLFLISEGFSLSGLPAPPSPPDCFILCDENCQGDIHCTWAPVPDSQTPCNYTLHWDPSYPKGQSVFYGPSLNGSIKRDHFPSHDDLRVWVQAENQYGATNSPEAKFNTAKIYKPLPPKVSWSVQEPLEISWTSNCDQLDHSLGSCDIRHRTEASLDWIQEKSDHGSFTFLDPQPCVVYEVQVRCACTLGTGTMEGGESDSGLKSDWSESTRKTSTGAAPVGKLDVWRDCEATPESSDCVLIWKKLPPSQACGAILGYEVRVAHLNSSVVMVNVSEDEHSDRFVCEETKCHLKASLKDGSSVSVLAYNAHGSSVPSDLSMPAPGEGGVKTYFDFKMTEENLNVTWNFPPEFSDTLKEYVVQYKQIGSPLGDRLDWVRVSNQHTSASFKGHFQGYTPYRVSLLTVSYSSLSSGLSPFQTLSSAIGYSLQGTPSKVPSFKVLSTDASNITVSWEPVPLLQQNGIILYYQIGVNEQKVYNVSASSTSKQMSLRPRQTYEMWIRAVTKAGPGENSTLTFTTKDQKEIGSSPVYTVLPVLVVVAVLVLLCLSISVCPGAKSACPMIHDCYEKVPDPRNSLIFRQKNQIHELPDWLHHCESQPKISLLEVVEIQSWAFKSMKNTLNPERPIRVADGDRSSQMDSTNEERRDSQKTNGKCGAQPYSKIIDSEEEGGGGEEEEDCWHSSKEELVESGYEKHFLPTAEEILCVE